MFCVFNVYLLQLQQQWYEANYFSNTFLHKCLSPSIFSRLFGNVKRNSNYHKIAQAALRSGSCLRI